MLFIKRWVLLTATAFFVLQLNAQNKEVLSDTSFSENKTNNKKRIGYWREALPPTRD